METIDSDSTPTSASRYFAAQFLAALVVLLCAAPFFEQFPQGRLIEAVLTTAVLVAAIPAVGGNHRTLVIASLLALPAVATRWIHHLRPDMLTAAPFLAGAMIFGAFVVAHHLRFILSATEVDTQILCAGVSAFLMLGLLWTFAYLFLESVASNSFHIAMGPQPAESLRGFHALYFSFGTLSGLSFGDITPATDVARMLALLESMTAMFYLAILISRLVALHTERAAGKSSS